MPHRSIRSLRRIRFDPLIRKGDLYLQMVPGYFVVPDAAADLDVLRGLKATAPIYQNEQIPMGRVSGGVNRRPR